MAISQPGTNDGRRRGYTHCDCQAGCRLPAERQRKQQRALRLAPLAAPAAVKIAIGFEAAAER